MRILALADLRGATERMPQVIDLAKRENVGAVVFAGNILGKHERAAAYEKALAEGAPIHMDAAYLHTLEEQAVKEFEAFFDAMGKLDVPVLVVPGYLDAPLRLYLQASLNHEVVEPNVDMIHRSFKPLTSWDLVFAGFGGAIADEAREDRYALVYPAWEARFGLDFLRSLLPKYTPVLIFATPPRRGDIDLDGGKHIGHPVIDDLIKTYAPTFAFVGGAPEGRGTVEIGPTLVVNPGALRDGSYAIVDTKTSAVVFGQLPEPATVSA
nr:hypothetical protein [Ardenticatena sp.]